MAENNWDCNLKLVNKRLHNFFDMLSISIESISIILLSNIALKDPVTKKPNMDRI